MFILRKRAAPRGTVIEIKLIQCTSGTPPTDGAEIKRCILYTRFDKNYIYFFSLFAYFNKKKFLNKDGMKC